MFIVKNLSAFSGRNHIVLVKATPQNLVDLAREAARIGTVSANKKVSSDPCMVLPGLISTGQSYTRLMDESSHQEYEPKQQLHRHERN